MVIYRNSLEKIWDFSRSRMTKQNASLESSRENELPSRAMWMTHGETCGDTWQAMCHNAW